MMFKLSTLLFTFFLGLQAVSAAYSNETIFTSTYYGTVTLFTTYCPAATVISTNGVEITVTGPTTVTITDCPCKVEKTGVFTVVSGSTVGPTDSTVTVVATATKATPAASAATSTATPAVAVLTGAASTNAAGYLVALVLVALGWLI